MYQPGITRAPYDPPVLQENTQISPRKRSGFLPKCRSSGSQSSFARTPSVSSRDSGAFPRQSHYQLLYYHHVFRMVQSGTEVVSQRGTECHASTRKTAVAVHATAPQVVAAIVPHHHVPLLEYLASQGMHCLLMKSCFTQPCFSVPYCPGRFPL